MANTTDKTVNIWVKIKGNADKALKSVATSLGSVDKGAKKSAVSFKALAGAVGGLVVLNQANKWMKESVRLALEQEKAEKKLSAALGHTSQELLDYASALQKKTTFGDEEILSAQAMIANFVKEEEQIKKLTPAILDLATAKGMSLTSAADLVTKSVASSTNAMTRYGIEIEGAAGSTERIDSAVKNLTKAFGGMAEAEAFTSAGQIKQMDNAIGDMREEIGEAMLPAILDVKNAFFDFYSIILDNEGTVLNSVKNVAQLISDTMLGWNHLLGGAERAERAAKNFDVVGKEIAYYKSQVMLAADSLAVLEERGITTGEEYERFTKTFEENNDALVASLTYLDELKLKQNGVEISVTETNGAINNQTTALGVSTEAMKKNADGVSHWVDQFRMLPEGDGGTEGGLLMQAILGNQEDDQAALEARKEMAFDIAQQTANGIAQISNAVNNRRQQDHDNEVRQQKEAVNNSSKSAKQKAKALKKIEEQASKDRLKLRLKEWRANLLMSIGNTALAVTKTLATMGLAGVPAAAIVTALGGISTGIIASNKPKAYHGMEVTNANGMKGDVNSILARDGERVLTPEENAASKKGGGSAQITYAPQLNFNGPVDESVLPTIEEMLKASEVGVARVIEDMFTNGTMNTENINGALAL